MALDDRQHVEAVAIVRRMFQSRMAGIDPEAWTAAEQWLRENHPEPAVYAAAMRASSPEGGE